MDEEIEALMQDALNELEELNNEDTTTNEDQPGESIGESIDEGEDGDHREDIDEDEDDPIDEGSEVDDEEEDEEDAEEYEDEPNENENSDSNEGTSKDFEPVEVEVNGVKLTLDSMEEVKAYLNKQNQASTKPKKSPIERIVEQGNLTDKDLALLIDAKNGNKAAIAKLANDSGIDIEDIEEDLAENYQQEFEPHMPSEVEEVAEEILSDEDLSNKFQATIKTVPQNFAGQLATDPQALRNFARHVKSGLAQEVIPKAIKAQMLNGKSFLENYAEIGREIANQNKTNEDTKKTRKVNPRANELKKKIRKTPTKGKTRGEPKTGDDIWNMSSEEFMKKFGG